LPPPDPHERLGDYEGPTTLLEVETSADVTAELLQA
jgi:hypothetical protein